MCLEASVARVLGRHNVLLVLLWMRCILGIITARVVDLLLDLFASELDLGGCSLDAALDALLDLLYLGVLLGWPLVARHLVALQVRAGCWWWSGCLLWMRLSGLHFGDVT
jgi:hypothetical protein